MKSIVVEAHPSARIDATHMLQSLSTITEVVSVELDKVLFENLAAHADTELALVGLPLPSIDGLPALSRLLQQLHLQHVAVLGETDSAMHMRMPIQLNASTHLLKSHSGRLIAAALELMLAGGRYVPASIVPTRPEANTAGSSNGNSSDDCALFDLTQRQYEILVLLSRGHPIKTISRMPNTSEATIKAHTNVLYRRPEVRNRTEAVFVVTQHGAMLLSQPNVEAETASSPARPLCLAHTS